MIDIVKQEQALNNLKRPAAKTEYFKIRNALVAWYINCLDCLWLNELSDSIKTIIVKELPAMTRQLNFS